MSQKMIMNVRRSKTALSLALASILLTGCLEESRDTRLQDSLKTSSDVEQTTFTALFDPGNSVIPFPNNLLFAAVDGSDGSVVQAADGTVNVPYKSSDADASVKAALSALDGFSTSAPMTTTFSSAIDSATVLGNVRLFQVNVNALTKAVEGVVAELTFGVDYVASTSGSTLAIVPLKPLAAKTSYLVTISNGLTGRNGEPARPSVAYVLAKRTTSLLSGGTSLVPAMTDEEAQKFEGVRLLTNAAEGYAEAYTTVLDGSSSIPDLAKTDIVLSWSFTTQSVGDVMAEVYSAAASATPTNSIVSTPIAALGAMASGADIYIGSLDVPYYLDKTAPLSGRWQYAVSGGGYADVHAGNPLTPETKMPVAKSTETIPVLLSIPQTTKPVSGWPVVIFQHGITQNRTNMLAVAGTFAAAGFAVVAIDLPLHGITPIDTNLATISLIGERTFDLDLVSQNADGSIAALGPDGVVDSSGRHFINFTSLLTGRDNLRQGAADLFTLTSALSTMSYDGVAGGDFDTSKIYFVGHSLGGMAGTLFLKHETRVRDAVLAMPGGGILKLLDGSAAFGPELQAGLLSQAGLVHGTADYEAFMVAAQTALDSADPINNADIASGRGVLMFEVLNETTMPNSVSGAPLSGTEPLATTMGLSKVTADVVGADLTGLVKFSKGHHASLLTQTDANGLVDADSAASTAEMQTQMATFVASDGASINVTDTTVLDLTP